MRPAPNAKRRERAYVRYNNVQRWEVVTPRYLFEEAANDADGLLPPGKRMGWEIQPFTVAAVRQNARRRRAWLYCEDWMLLRRCPDCRCAPPVHAMWCTRRRRGRQ